MALGIQLWDWCWDLVSILRVSSSLLLQHPALHTLSPAIISMWCIYWQADGRRFSFKFFP